MSGIYSLCFVCVLFFVAVSSQQPNDMRLCGHHSDPGTTYYLSMDHFCAYSPDKDKMRIDPILVTFLIMLVLFMMALTLDKHE
jgi:hypothetical protein